LLLEKKADPNIQEGDRARPLDKAISNKKLSMILDTVTQKKLKKYEKWLSRTQSRSFLLGLEYAKLLLFSI
jgi:hypothetical protein